MKKFYTLIVSLLLSCSAFGTHLMGGEMTVSHVSDSTYIIHLTAYRDTIGIPFAMSASFNLFDDTHTLISTSTVSQGPTSGTLIPGYPYGVETYFFTDTITVPGPGEYTVEWFNCCRNGAIQNLTDPLGENMFLSTTFTHYANGTNSTPVFLAPPVTFLPINQPWQYNSLPFDPNGDSLYWSIDTPLTTAGVYAAGWVTPSAAVPADAFEIDPLTGQIDWTPDMLGNFVASILVEEFRNGTKIGEIRRDYQMIVIPDTTKSPQFVNLSNVFTTNDDGYTELRAMATSPTTITLVARDPDGDPVEIVAFGEPFLLPNNPAKFQMIPYNGVETKGIFSWTPDNSQVREKPYLVVFRTRDQIFTHDETVLVYVDRFSDTAVPNENGMGNSYPNPVTNELNLPFHLMEAASVDFHIYSITGSKVMQQHMGTMPAGEHTMSIPLHLSAGSYFVKMMVNGGAVETQRLIISNRQ